MALRILPIFQPIMEKMLEVLKGFIHKLGLLDFDQITTLAIANVCVYGKNT